MRKRGREATVNLSPRHGKDIFVDYTEEENGYLRCTYPTHARWQQFEILSAMSPKKAQSLTTQRCPTY